MTETNPIHKFLEYFRQAERVLCVKGGVRVVVLIWWLFCVPRAQACGRWYLCLRPAWIRKRPRFLERSWLGRHTRQRERGWREGGEEDMKSWDTTWEYGGPMRKTQGGWRWMSEVWHLLTALFFPDLAAISKAGTYTAERQFLDYGDMQKEVRRWVLRVMQR